MDTQKVTVIRVVENPHSSPETQKYFQFKDKFFNSLKPEAILGARAFADATAVENLYLYRKEELIDQAQVLYVEGNIAGHYFFGFSSIPEVKGLVYAWDLQPDWFELGDEIRINLHPFWFGRYLLYSWVANLASPEDFPKTLELKLSHPKDLKKILERERRL